MSRGGPGIGGAGGAGRGRGGPVGRAGAIGGNRASAQDESPTGRRGGRGAMRGGMRGGRGGGARRSNSPDKSDNEGGSSMRQNPSGMIGGSNAS